MTTSRADFSPVIRKMGGPRISVLDADPVILEYIGGMLGNRCKVSLFADSAQFIDSLRESPTPDLILMDWSRADDSEEHPLSLLEKVLKCKPSVPVVMLACSAELQEVMEATRLGAADVILKPFITSDIDKVLQLYVAEANCTPIEVIETPLDENTSFVRCNKRMREIEANCTLVARTDIPVLILGESGTGKEIAAIFIHKMSARSQYPFLKVNCAAMPLDLLESELFGYEQGAFTGAVRSKPGKFEICNHGTIFLDEIGEMPTALQAKLLQVLQDGSFSRLGSRSTVTVDVRAIAATNLDIKAAIAHKTFREDLYYRLNGFSLHIPPLRNRRDEIPVLAKYFMRKVSAKFETTPLPMSPALIQALCSYAWPGNLRELENIIKRYVVLADEQAIIKEMNPYYSLDALLPSAEPSSAQAGLKQMVRNLRDDAESAVISETLEATGWNRKAAASRLQISYKALLYKIKQYNLREPQTA